MDFASITTGKFALNASMPALYVATSTPEDAVTGPMSYWSPWSPVRLRSNSKVYSRKR